MPIVVVCGIVIVLGCCMVETGDDGHSLAMAVRDVEVHTEARDLAIEGGQRGNRFGSGWWPWLHDGKLVLGGSSGLARLELVHLSQAQRELRLKPSVPPKPGSFLSAYVGTRRIARSPLADPTILRLPAAVGVGRATLQLSLSGVDQAFDVVAARVEVKAPRGNARVEGDDIIQTGASLLELPLHLLPGARVVGGWEPPAGARGDQEFQLVLRSNEGDVLDQFVWPTANGLHPYIDLGGSDYSGLALLQFLALGEGPAGIWKSLRLVSKRGPDGSLPAESHPSPPPPPLVVLYVLDALRADYVSDDSRFAPTFRRLAAEGFSFANHRAVAPSTLPSTRALFTGKALQGEATRDTRALAEIVREAGYATGLFSANVFVGPAYRLDRGFDYVAPDLYFDDTAAEERGFNDSAERVHQSALDWLSLQKLESPTFLYLHTVHPHNPYDPPPEIRDALVPASSSEIDGGTTTLLAIRDRRVQVNSEDVGRLRNLYGAGLAYNDRELAVFVDALVRRYGREKLLLILTSDHGEELFDHEGVLHGYTLYDEMLRVPLLFWGPSWIEQGSWDGMTSTLDLHATLTMLLAPHEPSASEGLSLLQTVQRRPSLPVSRLHVAAAQSVRGGLFSVQDERWKLILAGSQPVKWGMGRGRGRTKDRAFVFDLERDPDETENLLGLELVPEAWLAWNLERALEVRTSAAQPAEPLDVMSRQRLEALGYVE